MGCLALYLALDGTADKIRLRVETNADDLSPIAETVKEVVKLRAEVVAELPGSLPKDGIVVDDQRPVG